MPNIGDRRTRTGFAWFPIIVENKIYFLQSYSIDEVYYAKVSEKGLISHDWVPQNQSLGKRNKKPPKGYDRARGTKP